MEEHARDAEDSARRGPARRARRPRASTADSETDSADEAPPPPPPKKKRPRYKSDDPRRNPPPSVANLLADRNASLERAASVSSTASTSTAKVTFYVDETVMGDECLLINGSEEEGVTAYVAQTLACGVCQEPYRRATRPPSGEVVKWPPGSADNEGQVLTPYVSTRSTSKAIKNLTQITSYARFMRKKMRGQTRVTRRGFSFVTGRPCRRTRGGGRPVSEFFGGADGYGVDVSGSKTRMSGNRFGPGTRTINPLGAWLDDQSADSIPPLLRAIVAHQSAGLLRRTSHRGNSRSRRRRSSQSWRSSGRSRGRTGAAGLVDDDSSCSRSVAYYFGLPRGRASSGIEFSATRAGQVPSLAVVQSSRRRRLPPSWPSRVASFRPLG